MENHNVSQSITSPLLGAENTQVVDGMATNSTRMNRFPNRNSIRVTNSLMLSQVPSTDTAIEDEVAIEDEDESKGCGSKFCKLMETWPITFVLVAAAIGISAGIALSTWQPDDPSKKETAVLWIGLLGDLFIRALKMIVLPLVFVSIAISFMDMVTLGKAGKIVWTTIGLYLLTTVCASLVAVLSSVIFSRYYELKDGHGEEEIAPPDVRLGCTVDENDVIESYLTEQSDGSVICMSSSDNTNNTDTLFRLEDVNGHFQQSSDSLELAKLTFSESLYRGLFMQLIDDNMVGMFINNNFLGVVVLGAAFGVALTQLTQKMPAGVNWDRILTIQILEELLQVFMIFVGWVIKCTPFAIISLIASAIGGQSNKSEIMIQIGYLLAAIVVGLLIQLLVVYCGLYTFFVRKNPILYVKQMVPAFTMAFACSSSAATLPVTIDCVVRSGTPVGIARFVLPLGATINMDGATIQIVCSCVWLAYQNGITPKATDYILLVFCATFGSMGAAPVPSAAIVLIITSYTTTFGVPPNGEYPSGLAYVIAIDWLVDRLATMFNIGGDTIVAAVVAKKVGKDLEMVDQLGELSAEKVGGEYETEDSFHEDDV